MSLAVTLVVAGVAYLSPRDVVFPERVLRTWIPMIGHGQVG